MMNASNIKSWLFAKQNPYHQINAQMHQALQLGRSALLYFFSSDHEKGNHHSKCRQANEFTPARSKGQSHVDWYSMRASDDTDTNHGSKYFSNKAVEEP